MGPDSMEHGAYSIVTL